MIIILFFIVLFLFKNSFNIYFFNDDFFFLRISKIENFYQFLNFFNPFRNFFYRPISTEVFYFLIHILKNNLFLSHLIVFIFYFIGLYFLNKIIYYLTKDKVLSILSTFLYAINSSHVFQLYYFATFQEIAMFVFLTTSFYFYLKKNSKLFYFFLIFALLSKETAILFIFFLIFFDFIKNKKINLKFYSVLSMIAFIFYLIYKPGLNSVSNLDYYKYNFNAKLFLNNSLWYLLWSIGFHNYLPDYFPSIFSKPIPKFYQIINQFSSIKVSLILLFIYIIIFFIYLIFFIIKNNSNKKKFYLSLIIYNIINFYIFLGPILFFVHKWMVRLTIPLIFIIYIQTYFLISFLRQKSYIFKAGSIFLIFIYIIFNFLNIRIHEEFSSYLLESKISKKIVFLIETNKNKILNYNCIFFKDENLSNKNPWQGSRKLKVTLSDQNFLNLYIPDKKIYVYYNFENINNNINQNQCFVINTKEIF